MSDKSAKNKANTTVLALFIFLSAFSFYSDELLSLIPFSKYYALSLITALLFYIPSFFLKAREKRKGSFFKLKNFKLRWLPFTLSAAATATIGGIALNTLSITILPEEMRRLSLNPVANVSFDEPASAFLALVLIPAVFEEIFFRGAYLSSFGKEKRAVVIFAGAILFAVMHSNPYSFLATFFAGCIYGILVYILDSVYPAIIAHLINNLFTAFAFYFNENIKKAGLEAFVTVGAIMFLLICIYISLREAEKFIKISPKASLSVSERIEAQKGRTRIIDLSFLILISLWIVRIYLQLSGIWK